MPFAKPKKQIPLRTRALRMVARREYSRLELERKLGRLEEDASRIAEILDDFANRGWLSESRVVEQTSAVRGKRFGAQRVAYELRAKGVSPDAIAAALPALKASELERARAVWSRKFRNTSNDKHEQMRQIRFLQNRGFALETIFRIVKGTADDE